MNQRSSDNLDLMHDSIELSTHSNERWHNVLDEKPKKEVKLEAKPKKTPKKESVSPKENKSHRRSKT